MTLLRRFALCLPVLRKAGTAEFTLLAMLVLMAALILPPVWYLFEGSFRLTNRDGSPGAFTWVNYARLFADPALLTNAWNSTVFAFGSAVLAILLGGLQAWIVERTNAPFKALAHIGAIVSLAFPYILFVVTWLFILGRAGPVDDLLKYLFGRGSIIDVQSMWGMVLIEGLLWAPMVFLMLGSTFRSMDAALEEAAQMCGAGTWATIWRITLRLAVPALAALALLVFIRSIEAFEVPALVGLPANVNVLTTEIFLSLKMETPPNLGRASAFAVVLLLMVAVLLFFYGKIAKSAEKYQTITGKGFRPRLLDLGAARWLAGAILVLIFVVLVILPFVTLLWMSLLPFIQAVSMKSFRLLTFENYRLVLGSSDHIETAWNTIILSFGTASIVMALAVVCGWFIVRGKRGAWLLDQLGTMPLTFPGIVLAVAMMQVFLDVPLPIYGTIIALLIAFTVRFQPYGLRYAFAGIMQVKNELEEAAATSGGSPMQGFVRIVLPLVLPSIAAGWLFIFLLTARDLSIPLMLAGPNSHVMSVELFDLWTNGQAPELAAFGLAWSMFMALIAIGLLVFMRRSGAGLQGS
jgi:iron(III) transport system permease protein